MKTQDSDGGLSAGDLAAIKHVIREEVENAITRLATAQSVGADSGPLTTNETIAALRISRTKLYEMMKDGKLKPYRVGKHLRFPPSQVKRQLAAQGALTESMTPSEHSPAAA